MQLRNIAKKKRMPGRMKMGMGGRMMEPRSRFFMALASNQRLKILELLKSGVKSSQEIISAVGLNASVISRHLMIMRHAGLVSVLMKASSLPV